MIEVFFVFAWTRHCHLSEGESSRDEWCERLVSDWLAIRPDSSPLLTPNYLTEISLTVESEKKTILKTNVTQWVKECVYSTKRGKTEALPKYAGVYTSGVEPWRVTSIEPLTLSMDCDQPTDIRATSVQRMPYSPVHSRVITFPLKFTKKIRTTKTYKAEQAEAPSKPVYQCWNSLMIKDHLDFTKLTKTEPLLASRSTNAAAVVVIDAAQSAADLSWSWG